MLSPGYCQKCSTGYKRIVFFGVLKWRTALIQPISAPQKASIKSRKLKLFITISMHQYLNTASTDSSEQD